MRAPPWLGESRRVVAIMARESPGLTAALAATLVVRAAAPLGFVVTVTIVVANVPATIGRGLDSSEGRRLLVALGLMGLALLVQQVAPAVEYALGETVGRRLRAHLERRTMQLLMAPAGIAHIDDVGVQNDITTATRSVTAWPGPGDAARAIGSRLATQLAFVAACGVLVVFHWWVAVAVFVVGLWLQAQSVTSLTVQSTELQTDQTVALRRAGYFRDVALGGPAAKEVRIFGLGRWLVDRYAVAREEGLRVLRGKGVRGRRSMVASAAAALLVVTGSMLLLGWEAGTGRIPLTVTVISMQAMLTALRPIMDEGALRDGIILSVSLQSFSSLRDAEERIARRAPSLPGTATAEGLVPEIRFEDVSFRYPGQDRDVLSHLDLTIPAGDSLALVGANAAGKTTVVKLLCKFYEPTSGRITVGGVDMRELDAHDWQHRIAAIFQDYLRYPFSARENVRLLEGGAVDDTELLDTIARRAGLDGVVRDLPGGWDTPMSPLYTGGADVSGGQWQRLALARALYAAAGGAVALVLDEPTASLDMRAEAEIYDRFLELTAGTTTILISHRFATVRRASRICVLEGGRIIEAGSHDALMARGGRYAELFTYQAQRFTDEVSQ